MCSTKYEISISKFFLHRFFYGKDRFMEKSLVLFLAFKLSKISAFFLHISMSNRSQKELFLFVVQT